MVTEAQIDTLQTTLEARESELRLAIDAVRHISLRRPVARPTFIGKNPHTFVEFTQAERDKIFADVEIEVARIKSVL